MSDAVAAWLAEPGLARLWGLVQSRLERNGLTAAGSVTIAELTREERHAIGGLLGRPLLKDRVSVDLTDLDADLVRRSGIGGLVVVVEAVTATTLVSRPAIRTTRAAEREAPFVAARDWLRQNPLPGASWVEPWLATLRRAGILTGISDGPEQLRQALRVLATVTSRQTQQTRTALAATEVGDAHCLDDGTLLAHLVLRGLAVAVEDAAPRTTRERRELWERFGVCADAVSSTCLALGLRASGSGGVSGRLDAAAHDGDPIHLSAWDLRRLPGFSSGRQVLVCENPAVLEAIAQRFGGAVPVVCSSGQPALVVLDVLRRLVAAGTELIYHGDFDWPGISIANRLISQVGVRPWLMSAPHYHAAVPAARLRLTGTVVEPTWDRELGRAMQRAGLALHEESLLDRILDAVTAQPVG